MEPVVTMREPRDLLALIPYQLGFRPEASAVLVSLRGSRSRVGLVVRVDLADLADPVHGGQVARDVVTHVVGDGAARAVVVLYPGTEDGSDVQVPLARLREAGEHLLGTLTAWVVGPRGWWGAGCTDPGCCPEGGRPLAEIDTAPIGARMVFEGNVVAPSRSALAEVPTAGREARKSARGARDRWLARAEAVDGPEGAYRWRRSGLDAWLAEFDRVAATLGADATERRATPPAVAGRIEAALSDTLVRDAVLVSFLPGTDRAQDLLVGGVADPEVGNALRSIIDPQYAVPPEPHRVRAATTVLTQVVAHAPRDRRPPAQTLLAVLAWWSGDGARANLFVDEALARRPDYRLAVLVRDVLSTGMPPGWLARERRAAG